MKHRLLLPLLLSLLLTGCARQSEKQSVTGFAFDTVLTLTAYTDDDTLLTQALAKCSEYEQLLSATVEGSDVWNLNHAGGDWVDVSEDTAAVLTIAQEVYTLSDGAFDITVAPVSALWDFTSDTPALPDPEALSAALTLVDGSRLEVDGTRARLPDGMSVDLGGVAKGYIADRIAEFLQEAGVEHALLNFGGNVRVLGDRPDGTPWTVGIQDPDGATGDLIAAITLDHGSAVTSGTYQRYFELDGVRYHHLLDPATGYPVRNGLDSVTILCDDGGLADALSTACFVLGETDGLALVESLDGVEAAFLRDDGTLTVSSGWTDASS